MKVYLTPSAQKDLDRLPDKVALRITFLIKSLENDPYPAGSKKLTGWGKTYRARLGDYRVIYEIDPNQKSIIITRVKHRKEVYRN